jgi:replication factor A1
MSAEQIVELILLHRDGLTREEILKAIKKKKAASGELLTEEAAARLVAAEQGVEIRLEKQSPKVYIHQLVSGLNDVTVSGRVLHISATRADTRSDRGWRMAKLLVGDRTGTVAVVLWNDKAELAENIRPRQVVKVSHGYIRRSKEGGVELHVGQRGNVQVSHDPETDDLPQTEGFCRKIAELNIGHKRAIVEGVIQAIHPLSTFQRRDGTEGKVLRTILEDDSGQIPVVFWNNKAEDMANVEEGTTVLLVNARVRKSRKTEAVELHVEDNASVEVSHRPECSLRVADLKEGMEVACIEGTVATSPARREVTTRGGEKVSVASFELEDASGRVLVSVWRRHVESVERLTVGDRVRLRGVFVRRGFGGQPEVSTRTSSVVEIV